MSHRRHVTRVEDHQDSLLGFHLQAREASRSVKACETVAEEVKPTTLFLCVNLDTSSDP
ncbi:MAG: hypothetical protein PVF54_09075 [Anaerolineae bacterium]|jgi:hypothetical protein